MDLARKAIKGEIHPKSTSSDDETAIVDDLGWLDASIEEDK